jgi:hypothetical protein
VTVAPTWLLGLGLAVSTPIGLLAQDTVVVVRGGLLDASSRPARVAVARFNTAPTRFFESTTIARGERIRGDVAIYDSRLVVSGTVLGDIIGINADIDLEPGAEVVGEILIVGGLLRGLDRADVSGNTTAYSSRALVERTGDELTLRPANRHRYIPERRRRRPPFRGEATVVLTAATYNRVEGLPVQIGPRFSWGVDRSSRFSIEALGILRTAGDFHNEREDLGYAVQATAEFGAGAPITLGARVYDVVAPIEDWQLQDDEIGLGTLLWHRDYRDYYLKRGVTGFIDIEPARGLTLSAAIGRNQETSVSARDPWTPFQRNEIWRPNPLVDEGHITSFSARLLYDARRTRGSSSAGWYLSAQWERGTSDDLALVDLPPTVRPQPPGPASGSIEFDRLFLDVRRYERIGWSGQLALRAVGAGSIGEDDLPVQRRLSLGGPEPMPGFAFRRFACNGTVLDPATPALCDRMVLFQAQYRGNLSVSTGSNHDRRHRAHHDWDDWDFDDWIWLSEPTIVLFADAGTAWLRDDDPGDIEGDVGAGLEFGGVGIYAAKALTQGEELRVLLRLHRRF